jgi:hypothetical protein
MTAFSAAMDAIFADANMAADALWFEQGFGPGTACRVIRRAPDEVSDFGQGRFRSETTTVYVRVSDVATPMAGDLLTIGTEQFRVQGDPLRDAERLVWSLNLGPA